MRCLSRRPHGAQATRFTIEDNNKTYKAEAACTEIEQWFYSLDDPKPWWISIRDGGKEVGGKASGFEEFNWQLQPSDER